MASRLTEQYKAGDWVEIFFTTAVSPAEQRGVWQPGRVVRLDHPGLWVAVQDGRQWFVTNGRKIRPATPHE